MGAVRRRATGGHPGALPAGAGAAGGGAGGAGGGGAGPAPLDVVPATSGLLAAALEEGALGARKPGGRGAGRGWSRGGGLEPRGRRLGRRG